MKKFSIIHIILSLIICISACSNQPGTGFKPDANLFVVGQLANSKQQSIFLEELSPKSVNILDSAKTDENGNFSFGIKIAETGFYRLRITANNYLNFIAAPKDSIVVAADAANLESTYSISGSEESMRLKELNHFFHGIYKTNDSLNAALQTHQQSNDVNKYMSAVQFQQQLSSQFHGFVKNFIDKKPGSLASLAAVQNLEAEENFDYYEKVAEGLKATLPNSSYYKELKAKVDELKKLAIGSVAPEITLNDTNDKPVSLSSLKGKVVLIDFWASWCRPCRAENPNVVKMYNKYHNKGFEVFSVSLDKSKPSWISAIKQDGLIWKNHVSDLGYWNSSVVPMYNIKGIPLTYLLDKEGKIIGKNLRGVQLEQKLEEIFK